MKNGEWACRRGLPVPAPIVIGGGSGGSRPPGKGCSVIKNSQVLNAKRRQNEWRSSPLPGGSYSRTPAGRIAPDVRERSARVSVDGKWRSARRSGSWEPSSLKRSRALWSAGAYIWIGPDSPDDDDDDGTFAPPLHRSCTEKVQRSGTEDRARIVYSKEKREISLSYTNTLHQKRDTHTTRSRRVCGGVCVRSVPACT